MHFQRSIFRSILPCSLFFAFLASGPVHAQDLGVEIGSFEKLHRANGSMKREKRPVFLLARGDSCAEVVIETVVFSKGMWNDLGWAAPARTAWYELERAMTSRDDLIPPCKDVKRLNRVQRESTGELLYYMNGLPTTAAKFAEAAGLKAGVLAEETVAARSDDKPSDTPDKLAEGTSTDVTVTPSLDKPSSTGAAINLAKADPAGEDQLGAAFGLVQIRWGDNPLTRPVWVDVRGSDCAEIIVSTIGQGEENGGGSSAPTFMAWDTARTLLASRPEMLQPCKSRLWLQRVINEHTGQLRYFDSGRERMDTSKAEALLADPGGEGLIGGYQQLADVLPKDITWVWRHYMLGQFEGRDTLQGVSWGARQEAMFAFRGISDAYSKMNEAREDTCRFPGDTSAQLNSSLVRGDEVILPKGTDGRMIYYSPQHSGANSMAFEGTRNSLLRGWIAEGEQILSRAGCLSPAVYVLRENLNRFIFGNPPMSGDEVTKVFARMNQATKGSAEKKKTQQEAKAAAAEAMPKFYPFLTQNAEPFLRGCIASHTMGGDQMDDRDWLRCGCFEFAAQKLGDKELYSAFVRDFDAVYYRGKGENVRAFNGIANACIRSPNKAAMTIIGTYRKRF